ncbi:MAG: lysine--tRNA ligase [Dehalococcoidia bacterium]
MDEEEIISFRVHKLDGLRARDVDPYPARSPLGPRKGSAWSIERIRRKAESDVDKTSLEYGQVARYPGSRTAIKYRIAGRITGLRDTGAAIFADLRDLSGKIQLYFWRDWTYLSLVGRKRTHGNHESFDALRSLFDIGDYIEVRGNAFRTQRGELSIRVSRFTMLAKGIRRLPEKWHGLKDTETRYRQRYLDLISNPEVRETFITRSRVITAIRAFMDGQGFLEVETPVLVADAGGAAARPFTTYHNALDRQLYLRIALELYLKRLVIGGYDRVYEIGRIFRNEGASAKYNPEFTMLESYQAYADYNDVMDMVERLVAAVAEEVIGGHTVAYAETKIDLAPPWPRVTLRDAVKQHSGVDFEEYADAESLQGAMVDAGVPFDPSWGRGKLIDELLSVKVEPNLVQPTFLTDYPVELSPLAKRKPENPRLVERFELFIAGREVGNAYSELNDPIEQRERMLKQARLRAEGDEEVELADEDFLVALEHGMPPCGGLGIGIDRLVMALTGQSSIREVILFPHLREAQR